jgi:predicted nuclease with TOPRIM domain
MEAAMSRKTTDLPIDDRIAAAFGNGAKSGDVAVLIKEAEAAALSSGDAAERARNRALDPVLSAKEVQEARRQMEDAAFRRERLQTAVTKLRERLEEVKADEEEQRRRVFYEKVKAERDRLAAELADIYPEIEQKLRELLPRVAANDREIEHINAHALPSDGQRLFPAELIARGLRGFVENGVQIPRITETMRLPAFKYSAHQPFAWPRPR